LIGKDASVDKAASTKEREECCLGASIRIEKEKIIAGGKEKDNSSANATSREERSVEASIELIAKPIEVPTEASSEALSGRINSKSQHPTTITSYSRNQHRNYCNESIKSIGPATVANQQEYQTAHTGSTVA